MRKGTALWTVFLLLGALLWLVSVGVWRQPLYRLILMVASLSWFAQTASAPRSN